MVMDKFENQEQEQENLVNEACQDFDERNNGDIVVTPRFKNVEENTQEVVIADIAEAVVLPDN